MSVITHVFFDCDGTLVDSESIAMAAMQRAAQSLGLTMSLNQCYRVFLGHSRQHCLEWMEKKYSKPLPPDFAATLATAIRKELEDKLNPVPGVQGVLATLPLRKFVISNGSPAHIAFVLKRTGLAAQFTNRYFSATQPYAPKPSPALYLQTMDFLKVSPAQCIAVEDSAAGVMSATSAGIKTLGFAMLSCPSLLLEAGAIATFQDMNDLPRLIHQAERGFTTPSSRLRRFLAVR